MKFNVLQKEEKEEEKKSLNIISEKELKLKFKKNVKFLKDRIIKRKRTVVRTER